MTGIEVGTGTVGISRSGVVVNSIICGGVIRIGYVEGDYRYF